MQKENLKLDKLNNVLGVNMFIPLPDDYLDLISMCSSNNKYLKIDHTLYFVLFAINEFFL